ncbi:MAG: hypothetical protein ACW99F_00345 [Candidatus Hodarchaeales archaeon]|jgi:hypothetical protein
MNTVGSLANDIASGYFSYLTGSELDSQITSISGWLETNFGQLNNMLYTSFSGANAPLKLEEQAIYTQLYLKSYYVNKANRVLRNIDNDADWVRITEGDTTLVRTNKNEVAKSYRALSKDAEEMAKSLTASYHSYLAQPLQVAGTDSYTGLLNF